MSFRSKLSYVSGRKRDRSKLRSPIEIPKPSLRRFTDIYVNALSAHGEGPGNLSKVSNLVVSQLNKLMKSCSMNVNASSDSFGASMNDKKTSSTCTTYLKLRHVELTDVQCTALSKALKEVPIMSALDLRDNLISEKGARALLNVMKEQLHASLNNWHVGNEAVLCVAMILLEGNAIPDELLAEIEEVSHRGKCANVDLEAVWVFLRCMDKSPPKCASKEKEQLDCSNKKNSSDSIDVRMYAHADSFSFVGRLAIRNYSEDPMVIIDAHRARVALSKILHRKLKTKDMNKYLSTQDLVQVQVENSGDHGVDSTPRSKKKTTVIGRYDGTICGVDIQSFMDMCHHILDTPSHVESHQEQEKQEDYEQYQPTSGGETNTYSQVHESEHDEYHTSEYSEGQEFEEEDVFEMGSEGDDLPTVSEKQIDSKGYSDIPSPLDQEDIGPDTLEQDSVPTIHERVFSPEPLDCEDEKVSVDDAGVGGYQIPRKTTKELSGSALSLQSSPQQIEDNLVEESPYMDVGRSPESYPGNDNYLVVFNVSGDGIVDTSKNGLTTLEEIHIGSMSYNGMEEYDEEYSKDALGGIRTWIATNNLLGGGQFPPKLPPVPLANLQVLDISYNKLKKLNFFLTQESLPCIRTLVLEHNDLSTLRGLDTLSSLEELRVGFNNIRDLSSLAGLTNLKILDARNNQISNHVSLRGLSLNTSLEAMWLLENPVSFHQRYRQMIIHLMPFLKSLDEKAFPRARARSGSNPTNKDEEKEKQISFKRSHSLKTKNSKNIRKNSRQPSKRQSEYIFYSDNASNDRNLSELLASKPHWKDDLSKLAVSYYNESSPEDEMDDVDTIAKALLEIPAETLRRHILQLYQADQERERMEREENNTIHSNSQHNRKSSHSSIHRKGSKSSSRTSSGHKSSSMDTTPEKEKSPGAQTKRLVIGEDRMQDLCDRLSKPRLSTDSNFRSPDRNRLSSISASSTRSGRHGSRSSNNYGEERTSSSKGGKSKKGSKKQQAVSSSLLTPTDAFRRKTVQGAKDAEMEARKDMAKKSAERQAARRALARRREKPFGASNKSSPHNRKSSSSSRPPSSKKVNAVELVDDEADRVVEETDGDTDATKNRIGNTQKQPHVDKFVLETRYADWKAEAHQQLQATKEALNSLLKMSESVNISGTAKNIDKASDVSSEYAQKKAAEFKERLVDVGLFQRMNSPPKFASGDERNDHANSVLRSVEMAKAAVRNFVALLESEGRSSENVERYREYVIHFDPTAEATALLQQAEQFTFKNQEAHLKNPSANTNASDREDAGSIGAFSGCSSSKETDPGPTKLVNEKSNSSESDEKADVKSTSKISIGDQTEENCTNEEAVGNFVNAGAETVSSTSSDRDRDLDDMNVTSQQSTNVGGGLQNPPRLYRVRGQSNASSLMESDTATVGTIGTVDTRNTFETNLTSDQQNNNEVMSLASEGTSGGNGNAVSTSNVQQHDQNPVAVVTTSQNTPHHHPGGGGNSNMSSINSNPRTTSSSSRPNTVTFQVSGGNGGVSTNTSSNMGANDRMEGVILPDELVKQYQKDERTFYYDNESVASSVWSIEGQASVKKFDVETSITGNNQDHVSTLPSNNPITQQHSHPHQLVSQGSSLSISTSTVSSVSHTRTRASGSVATLNTDDAMSIGETKTYSVSESLIEEGSEEEDQADGEVKTGSTANDNLEIRGDGDDDDDDDGDYDDDDDTSNGKLDDSVGSGSIPDLPDGDDGAGATYASTSRSPGRTNESVKVSSVPSKSKAVSSTDFKSAAESTEKKAVSSTRHLTLDERINSMLAKSGGAAKSRSDEDDDDDILSDFSDLSDLSGDISLPGL